MCRGEHKVTFGAKDFQSQTGVSRETMENLVLYADLLKKWQPAKNLIANSTLDVMWSRHFWDSAQMCVHLRRVHGEKPLSFLDIGSGAGFPGLVLSIMGLGPVTLVESNGRKCAFMRQVAMATGANARVENKRIEDVSSSSFDIITSRACASVEQLLDWGRPFIHENLEFWLLKGENVDKELTAAQELWNMSVEKFKSETDPGGTILRLSGITFNKE